MKTRAFCPNCGTDIVVDEPIRIDDFHMMGDGFPLCFKGRPLKLTGNERILMWSLMKAYPNHVSVSTLLNRIDSDALGNIIRVHVTRIRKKFTEWDLPQVVETVRGCGYRWKPGGGDGFNETPVTPEKSIPELLGQLYHIRTPDRPAE